MTGLAFYALCYLSAAVLAVIVCQKVGLGSVVGYIAAGVVVGPVLHISEAGSSDLQQFSEFGIVMMLFLIGLEIDPQMVWRLKGRLLGLGGFQTSLTVGLAALLCAILGFSWQQSVLFGFVAALSSTAIVLQTLEERGQTGSDGGQASFAVLLFQDLAVIPMLACLPLLGGSGSGNAAGHGGEAALLVGFPAWLSAIVTLAAIALVVAVAHFLSRPVFRAIASLGLREVFTAAALLVVVGIAVLMSAVGLSPALGAFLGGVVLANSEFKHELQNDIEPFKGLLLGLFFMTIGAKIDIEILLANWLVVLEATLALIILKVIVLWPLAWFFRIRGQAGWLLALGLAQAGEFGFVLLSIGGDQGLLPPDVAAVSVLVVTSGMVFTPLLFALCDRVVILIEQRGAAQREASHPDQGTIILAGVGRFGQIVNRMLLANGYKPVILDHRADVVENVRKFGVRSFFGDASRPDLLRSAGLAKAALLVVAIDDPDRATEIVTYARRSNPNIVIVARAYDRLHHYKLLDAGADHIVREVFEASVEAAGIALNAMGMHPYEVEKRKAVFVEQDLAGLARMASLVDDMPVVNNPLFIAGFNDIGKVIENAMMGYRSGYDDMVARGWNAPDLSSIHVPAAQDVGPRVE